MHQELSLQRHSLRKGIPVKLVGPSSKSHLAVCPLVKHWVWATILLLKALNEGHNIPHWVCDTAAGSGLMNRSANLRGKDTVWPLIPFIYQTTSTYLTTEMPMLLLTWICPKVCSMWSGKVALSSSSSILVNPKGKKKKGKRLPHAAPVVYSVLLPASLNALRYYVVIYETIKYVDLPGVVALRLCNYTLGGRLCWLVRAWMAEG